MRGRPSCLVLASQNPLKVAAAIAGGASSSSTTGGLDDPKLAWIASLSKQAKSKLVRGLAIVAGRKSERASRHEWATAAGTAATAIGSAELQAELSEIPAVARAVCLGCGRTERPDGAHILACAGCRTARYLARFCSRACQKLPDARQIK